METVAKSCLQAIADNRHRHSLKRAELASWITRETTYDLRDRIGEITLMDYLFFRSCWQSPAQAMRSVRAARRDRAESAVQS